MEAIDQFFPLRTVKRRNIDPPWINTKIKKLIKARAQRLINLEIPVLVRSLKSSNVKLS